MDKEMIKQEIQRNIEEGLFDIAEDYIKQYRNIFGFDDEIASMEAIINIYSENYEDAMDIVRQGLKYNIYSSDLYYTMGNLYEINKKYENAYLCYEQALKFTEKEDVSKIIIENLNRLKEEENIKIHNYSIVMLTYNQLEYTKVCINSIRKYNSDDNCEIIIVDNHSTDGTVEWLKDQGDIKYILNNENRGFPAGCNQGIELSQKDNDIFLLNNDTVIMPNSIFNLRMGLYSDENIGATGAISNSVSYYQQISQQYEDFNGYMNFAISNNITNNNSYDQRVKLVGFAMLIKRNVLDKVGLLDERFTPGNYEDDDLSLRIIIEGYKLLLCKDSYIHHFGSVSFRENADRYNELLSRNSDKFMDKWGTRSEELTKIDFEIINKIKKENEEKFEVLYVNCKSFATLLEIKKRYRNCKIYVVREKGILNKLFSNLADIQNGDIEQLNFEQQKFDYIILNNVLEKCDKPKKTLKHIKKYLNPNGKIVIKVKNSINYNFIKKILNGMLSDDEYKKTIKNNKSIFKLNDIVKLINLCGYVNMKIEGLQLDINRKDMDMIKSICKFTDYRIEEYKIDEYLLTAECDCVDNNKPLISICIPTYNRASNLDICLKSIFEQIEDDDRFQIVISNNNSSDYTEEIIEKYINKYQAMIKYNKNNKNIGASKNFLKVLDIAEGKYLLLHGDDDYFINGSIYELYNVVKENMDKSVIFLNVLDNSKSIIEFETIGKFMNHVSIGNSTFMSSLMFRKRDYDKIENRNEFLESNLQQVYLLFSILKNCPKSIVYNNYMFTYGENNLDISYSWSKIFIENVLTILKYLYDNKWINSSEYDYEKENHLRYFIMRWITIFKNINKLDEKNKKEILDQIRKNYCNEIYYEDAINSVKEIVY